MYAPNVHVNVCGTRVDESCAYTAYYARTIISSILYSLFIGHWAETINYEERKKEKKKSLN